MKLMQHKYAALVLLMAIILAACNDQGTQETESAPPPEFFAETPIFSTAETNSIPLPSTPTNPPPSPTPQLAALVNGQPILLAAYEKELARYELAQAELGLEADAGQDGYHQVVLDALIERELMRQAAVVYGISITPEQVDEKIDELRQSASEHGSFDTWLQTNQWTLDEFREAMATEMIVEEVVVTVTADVPYAVEQVRARYIQVDNPNEADSILNQYREGSDFGTLAERYSLDQATAPYGGDLGFFARGSLLVPEVETAAFDLQLDEVSDVLAVTDPQSSSTTYYLVQLTDRESSRPLTANLRYKLLQDAFDQWMEELKGSATVIKFIEGQ